MLFDKKTLKKHDTLNFHKSIPNILKLRNGMAKNGSTSGEARPQVSSLSTKCHNKRVEQVKYT